MEKISEKDLNKHIRAVEIAQRDLKSTTYIPVEVYLGVLLELKQISAEKRAANADK